MQISIDNVQPDEISKKSLKVLDKKLQFLAEYAEFHVNINSVVGGGIKNPQDALTIGHRALELGFTSTIGIIHDGSGQLKPLGGEERRVYYEMTQLEKKNYSRFNHFQEAIANGQPNDWRCRAGSRYLYVCEDGLVHYCSQQRGYPGTPLAEYTQADLDREFLTEKTCCAELHGLLRAPDLLHRPLAGAAEPDDDAAWGSCGSQFGSGEYRAVAPGSSHAGFMKPRRRMQLSEAILAAIDFDETARQEFFGSPPVTGVASAIARFSATSRN